MERGLDAGLGERPAAVRDALAASRFLTSAADAPAVVVPIHDAFDDTLACLESVARKTTSPFRLVLINDGSRDPRLSALLAALREVTGLIPVDRADNRGFVRTVNEGFALAPASDVVILNSDTLVTAGWLERLCAAATRRANVATVTPLTNNGTICSVPLSLEDNALPADYDVDRFAALIAECSLGLAPEAPTGVGFCMLITRRALDAVGGFDADAFGDGYGEENDFCQRAIRAGFVNLIADDTFVYHKGRASFGARAAELLTRNLATLAARHPDYHADVARFCAAHPLRLFHDYLARSIAAGRERRATIRARVLHLLHEGGGTEKHARELAALDDPGVLSYVLMSDGRALAVDELHAGRRLRSLWFPLPTPIGPCGPLHDAGYRDALTAVCRALSIDLVHVHHLMHHTLDVARLGLPYVMTLHDYYAVCPRYTLLDPEGGPCGACTGRGPRDSPDTCMKALGQPDGYLDEHQEAMGAFLRGAARLFAPNVCVQDIVGARFPDAANTMTVIEHGYHATAIGARRRPAVITGNGRRALHVAILGALDVHKGSGVLRDLLRANLRGETTFHFYGTAPDAALTAGPYDRVRRLDGSRFVYHGPYAAGEIVGRLAADGIHVGLQLAVWPETFSYTLSELAEAGIPVIAGNLGAQGERVRRCRLGWTVDDIRDPAATLAILDGILRDPATLDGVARAMRRDLALPPMEAMWRRYLDAYDEILTPGRSAMERTPETSPEETPSPRYVASLAMGLAEVASREAALRRQLEESQAEADALRSRLRSPRHRIAEALGNALQRVPVLWPLLARLTEAVLRRPEHRAGPGA